MTPSSPLNGQCALAPRWGRPEHACGRGTRGLSLVTVLLMAAALAALAMAGMSSSVVQERMAGHARDRNLALQAAEAALRDAEADVEGNLTSLSAFVPDCTDGLCVPPSMAASGATSTPRWQTVNWSPDARRSRVYGGATGAPALPDVESAPRYIVELLPSLVPSSGQSVSLGTGVGESPQAFRITVRATGRRSSTVVVLQSTYIKS